jgi:hypothetical protein
MPPLPFAAMLLIAAACLGSGTVRAQTPPQPGATPVARFAELVRTRTFERAAVAFAPLPEHTASATEFEIINGKPAERRHFPTVFQATTAPPCTAQLVGATALLTAAHCVSHNTRVKITIGREMDALCERAPGYRDGDDSQDWALCLLEFQITGVLFETIADSIPEGGQRVVLAGYGCTSEGGPMAGQLLVGKSTLMDRDATSVISQGQHLTLVPRGNTLYTKSSIAAGDAVLCPGDSGGPLFIFASNSYADARRLIAVNSETTFTFGVSLFAATGSAAARSFFQDWARDHGQTICGVNTSEHCR